MHSRSREPKPLLLDLFCGQGGAGAGYAQAGFDVIGVDISPQPRYPFVFVRENALAYLHEILFLRGAGFAAVHASPPCQRWSTQTKRNGTSEQHPDLIEPVRELLQALGLPYVIENVVGAPLVEPETACGAAFALGVDGYRLKRHRLFEASFPLVLPGCQCWLDDRPTLDVTGGGDCSKPRTDGKGGRPRKGNAEQARRIMSMPWATKSGCNEAIPPAYTAAIGPQLLAAL